MQVSPVHHEKHTLPVQPTPPVQPVRAKPEHAEGPPKVKAATPPHVGTKVDVHA
ncbi:MAG TPA: hypothetical protein VGC92_10490 [Phenylobacterium sp.]|jgi:hypothetical protein